MALIDRAGTTALIPEDAAHEIIKAVTEESALLRLGKKRAGMTRKQQRIPMLNSKPTATFVNGDTGLKAVDDIDWTSIYLNAEPIAVVVPISEEVAEDADYDLETELMPEIVEAFGVAIDAAMLHGTNKPSTWPTAIVPGALAASNTAVTSSFTDIYDAVMGDNGAISMVEQDGYMVNGHVAGPRFRGKLRGLRSTEGIPIFTPDMTRPSEYLLDGQPIYFPRNGAFNSATVDFVTGDWDQLQYSLRSDITMKLFTEGVITDESGNVLLNLMQQDSYALRFLMRIAFVITNPVNRLNANSTTRYPFATLTVS